MVERRKHKRYPMPRGTFVILRNEVARLRDHAQMSIGEIAMILYKSQPEIMGQVTDMSFGGIAFQADTDVLPTYGEVELDILMTEHGIYLHNIPFVLVPVTATAEEGKTSKVTRRNAFHFAQLDEDQRACLRDLLAHHTG